MSNFSIILLLLLGSYCNSCVTAKFNNDECVSEFNENLNLEVHSIVTVYPEYSGGNIELAKYLSDKMVFDSEEDFQGTFLVDFIVDRRGALIVTAVNGKKIDKLSNSENNLWQIMEEMPRWDAGKCGRKKVAVKMKLPLKF
jgi:hypothetical protein